jgi:hypothetical protein
MNSYIIHYTGSQNYDAEKAHQPKKSLSSVGLIFMVFFAVSGGAFGLEDGLGKGNFASNKYEITLIIN